MVVAALILTAGLLAIVPVAIAAGRSPYARFIVYGASLAASVALLLIAIASIFALPSTAQLPLGLPWIGAHFRLDALSAFFLAVVSLGGAAASLYAIGYGAHETAPMRVLPFYPAFLAGMNAGRARRRRLHRSSYRGNSCRSARGRWSWRIIARATTHAPATST